MKGLKYVNESIWVIATRPRETTIASHLVMRAMQTDFSHIAIMYYSKDNRGFLISHADTGPVSFDHYGTFIRENKPVKVFQIRVGVNQCINVIKSMVRFNGTKYSLLGVLGILMGKMFQFDWNVFQTDSGAIICSEYVDRILGVIGVKTTSDALGIPKDLVTPADNVRHLNRLSSRSPMILEVHI